MKKTVSILICLCMVLGTLLFVPALAWNGQKVLSASAAVGTAGNFGAPTQWDNSPYFPTEEDNNTKAYRYYEGYDDGNVVEKIGYAENFQRIKGPNSYTQPGALNSGAYYLDKNSYNEFSDHLYIKGDVLLILGDGCTIKSKKGITVPEGSTLRIARE